MIKKYIVTYEFTEPNHSFADKVVKEYVRGVSLTDALERFKATRTHAYELFSIEVHSTLLDK